MLCGAKQAKEDGSSHSVECVPWVVMREVGGKELREGC